MSTGAKIDATFVVLAKAMKRTIFKSSARRRMAFDLSLSLLCIRIAHCGSTCEALSHFLYQATFASVLRMTLYKLL